ncbi:MAG TPA: ferrochelatase [Candidatus Binatia bacterium]|jgi:ferrochelatase
MKLSHDAVLLLSFGGPTSPEQIRPFLARVLAGHPVPPARIAEVVRHYEAVGGRSPLKDITFLQAHALDEILKQLGLPLPIYVGMRHSPPFIPEALDQMTGDGVKRALAFILSPHQTEASWERYQQSVADARNEIGDRSPHIDYCPGWHNHPLYIQVWEELIEDEMEKLAAAERDRTSLIFTAHSVPTSMAASSPYCAQLQESCSLVAARLNHPRWSIAYQSRSGNPREPWLEPDISEALHNLAGEKAAPVVVAPIGFVAEHVEVLYDLDIAAKQIAAGLGLKFFRAGAPNDHPTFIRMVADVIEAALSGKSPIAQ